MAHPWYDVTIASVKERTSRNAILLQCMCAQFKLLSSEQTTKTLKSHTQAPRSEKGGDDVVVLTIRLLLGLLSAHSLSRSSTDLQKRRNLMVHDCLRPFSVSRYFWTTTHWQCALCLSLAE
jgi:hypothetical protein